METYIVFSLILEEVKMELADWTVCGLQWVHGLINDKVSPQPKPINEPVTQLYRTMSEQY